MLHHRRQHGLDVINHHMVTPCKQRPSPGSLQETLTGPWGKTGMALSTHLNQIEDVVNQQLRAVLERTTLLQLLQRLGAKPGQAFRGWIKPTRNSLRSDARSEKPRLRRIRKRSNWASGKG